MAALLVTIAVMGILMTVAMPTWRQQARREKEAELIWRAGQYVQAVERYKKKNGNAWPTSVDVLVKGRFLRKKYLDPMSKDGKGDFRLVSPQELQGSPTGIRNIPGGGTGTQPGSGARPFGSAGNIDNKLGSGTAMTGSGLGSNPGNTGGPGFSSGPGSGSGSGFPNSSSGPGNSIDAGFQRGPDGTQIGPFATVASRSTEQSIRIFKGRDHYNQWIVTIEDVVPRQFLRQQQPNQPGQRNQPGQQPGQNPGSNPTRPTTPTTPSSPKR